MLEFFSTSTIMATIPLGTSAYELSWIEAIGTLFGLI
ncbi:MAG: nicotinamide riboside transporter PnuC, partial [Enterobacteriaceae bacterium]